MNEVYKQDFVTIRLLLHCLPNESPSFMLLRGPRSPEVCGWLGAAGFMEGCSERTRQCISPRIYLPPLLQIFCPPLLVSLLSSAQSAALFIH